MAALLVSLLVLPVAAAVSEDGTYAVSYTVYQGPKDSVSIANDYFVKPATVIVQGEQRVVELTLNHASWILELAAVDGQTTEEVEVVSEDQEQDLRVVRFAVDDIAQQVEMQVHVRIEEMEPVYDHRYTVRLLFDEPGAEWVGPVPEWASHDSREDKSSAPQIVYLSLMAVAVVLIVLFTIWMFRSRDKAKKNDQL